MDRVIMKTVSDIIRLLLDMIVEKADSLNIDRDLLMKEVAEKFDIMAQISTIKNWGK